MAVTIFSSELGHCSDLDQAPVTLVSGWSSWVLWVNPLSVILVTDGRRKDGPRVSPLPSLTAITTSDVISYSRGGGRDSNWNSDDSFLYSENVAELFSSMSPMLHFNLFYHHIWFDQDPVETGQPKINNVTRFRCHIFVNGRCHSRLWFKQ